MTARAAAIVEVAAVTAPAKPATQGLLDYDQAAARLGLKVTTLRSLVSRRQVPHVRIGPRLVRFDAAELDALIASSRVPIGGA